MTALLLIIYLAFISLGLPDTLLGSSWPVIQAEFSAPFAVAGYVVMLVSAGTIISSLFSNRLIHRFGTGKVTAVSVLMTAVALLGYTFVQDIWLLFVCAIPMGLGAGSVDAALNNFIALHYKAKHMNWLHCFWGVGATVGPMILSFSFAHGGSWRDGYRVIGIFQSVLVVILFATLPLWKKANKKPQQNAKKEKLYTNREILKMKYVKPSMIAFAAFCATEGTAGIWAGSYLTAQEHMTAADAAMATSGFYLAITLGRLLAGFISGKCSGKNLIRYGQLICILGAVLIMLPVPTAVRVFGIWLVGFGTAPIYPSMLHETPRRFGEEISQGAIGLEMAFAYIGSTCTPPVFGILAEHISVSIYPYFILLCVLAMLVPSELLRRKNKTELAIEDCNRV